LVHQLQQGSVLRVVDDAAFDGVAQDRPHADIDDVAQQRIDYRSGER
jgi:hypothetical protein